ncbi:hypothetical protein BGZ68_002998 [Mortierella alpina]|nr:hypothetical protein BGZ68_002998 [Mortierella alpina]
MAADVFALPELAEIMAQYLPPRDIAACRLTSRAFHNTFNPYLWKHISVFKPAANKNNVGRAFLRVRASGSLYRNRQHLETLNLEIFAAECLQSLLNSTSADDVASASSAPGQESAGTPRHPEFPSLKFLSITVGAIKNYPQLDKKDAVIPDDSLKILLKNAPNITSLTLYPEVLKSAHFMATLKSGLPHLRTLILKKPLELFNKPLPVGLVLFALSILLAKPKLTTLGLDFYLLYDEETSPTLVSKTIMGLAQNPRANSAITSMIFPKSLDAFPLAFVKPMLEFCLPQLQILNIPSIGAPDLARLIKVVPNHCPHVFYKGLRAYRGPAFGAGEDRRAITHALLQHGNTLESLVFTEMTSSAFASVISSMLALRTLVVRRSCYVEIEGAISVRWAPRRLQRLEMVIKVEDTIASYVKSQKLDLDPELNPGSPSEGLDDEAIRYVAIRKLFKNIGELTELEDLSIRHHSSSKWKFDKDWSLKVGLGFLGGLVKLRKLRLDYGAQHIGQTEIEFIYKHWPNLEEVYFQVERRYLDKSQRTWGWLKSRRPDLKLTYEFNMFVDRVIIF